MQKIIEIFWNEIKLTEQKKKTKTISILMTSQIRDKKETNFLIPKDEIK